MRRWEDYLTFLRQCTYSVDVFTSNLVPDEPILSRESVEIGEIGYELWPFQQHILERMEGDVLILGLPTGLGKTYLAGAYLKKRARREAIRVLFIVPSIPLGVQQTLFARRMLHVNAYFISGAIPPDSRHRLRVWNAGYVVSTPQTFYNDILKPHSQSLSEAKMAKDPVTLLSHELGDSGFTFPYDIVIADECQGYIGETDGYSILLAAKACDANILALSATPQLHSPRRLKELKRVFDRIETFSIDDPNIKRHMPDRLLTVVRIPISEKLLQVYSSLERTIRTQIRRIAETYCSEHVSKYCKEHPMCVGLIALRVLRFRLVEDGASSVQKYGIWRLRNLRNPRQDLEGKSIYQVYREALAKNFNHKFPVAANLLEREAYEKAILYVEAVEAAKQLGGILQKKYGLEDVAILVGKGGMDMDQQASALQHFKERARILVSTSVGEEGLDIPSADLEIWIDPPSNPKKWVQRFGRILRQPGDKPIAKTYALVSMLTHERNKLLGVKRSTEKAYGFTQRMVEETYKALSKGQKSLTQYF